MALITNLKEKTVCTIDLNFMGNPGTIAAYLILHNHGAILIESGPGSTLPFLLKGLKLYGLGPEDITDVLLTHIHLDHAGAAGWLANKGARVHVHPVGAAHLLNPEKLLTSAARIYGNMMDTLWGDFLPVPAQKLNVVEDGEILDISGLHFRPLDTPGHAEHHYVYLYEDTLFSGDIAGIRLDGLPHVRIPMPPPEFNLEKWRNSLSRLESERFAHIAPTHFGLYDDPDWHLAALRRTLDNFENWMENLLPADPTVERINQEFMDWTRRRSEEDGLNSTEQQAYETANPSWMSGYGIQRYWKKFRESGSQTREP